MASLSISPSLSTIRSKATILESVHHQTKPSFVSCQIRFGFDPPTDKEKEGKEKKESLKEIFVVIDKLGRGIKDSLSPKQKGDWKDLVLMSLSFAVYVYISQRIVCAYCAWNSMFQNHW